MNKVSLLAQQAIAVFEQHLTQLKITPVIHFELEGAYQAPLINGQRQHNSLNFSQLNNQLAKLKIDAELKPEYWRNQWEYVSLFNGQSPLQEAKNLVKTMQVLPKLFKQQGINNVLIKPVIWSGDHARLLSGCQSIFSASQQAVHIPNAVQLNISAKNAKGENLVPKDHFGEILQNCLLTTSYNCCLLFLPEEEAFQRIHLKKDFKLDAELSSPNDISGGHQGSIALYKKVGKHNQPMGQTPLIFDKNHQALLYKDNWQSTSRVEHRLGASSWHYCPFVNVAFSLANLVDAITQYHHNISEKKQAKTMVFNSVELPSSLYQKGDNLGAVEVFQQDTWFAKRINSSLRYIKQQDNEKFPSIDSDVGGQLQQAILNQYIKAPVMKLSENTLSKAVSK